jgi:hypothetical protein
MEWEKPWYEATRHTFASHWVKAGRPLAQLANVLGHSATWVTERYAHLRPDDTDTRDLLDVGLWNGQRMGSVLGSRTANDPALSSETH